TLISGGFPCQDLSYAGRRAGIDGERSGLWREFARIILELRPRYALVENVPGLLSGGLSRVVGDLAEAGYDAEWTCLRAADAGAPHRRERVFRLAYPGGDAPERHGGLGLLGGASGGMPETAWQQRLRRSLGRGGATLADAARGARQRATSGPAGHAALSDQGGVGQADTEGARLSQRVGERISEQPGLECGCPALSD